MNNKLLVGGIFFDLEETFEYVNHNVLLIKLILYGINGREYK